MNINSLLCKGTVRTPTALSGQEHRETRLVAPFCDVFTIPPVVGKVTQSVTRVWRGEERVGREGCS